MSAANRAFAPKRRLVYDINTARHCLMKFLDAGCRDRLGISVTQLSALMVLHEREGCLMKDLAGALMLDKSAVTGLARRMETAGLIARMASKDDARATRLLITGTGHTLLNRGLRELREVNKAITRGFSEAELATVSRFLEHLTTTFGDAGNETAPAGNNL